MIKAIETRYGGCRFRSRLEARWAVFFDACDIKWEYEPEGFILDDGTKYLPDFYLTDLDTYIEIKPTNSGFEKAIKFSKNDEIMIALIHGLPSLSYFVISGTKMGNYFINTYFWASFYSNIKKKVQIFPDHGSPYWDDNIPIMQRMRYLAKKLTSNVYNLEIINNYDIINNAIEKAKSARFEFGERG